jgi:hypothetical protein
MAVANVTEPLHVTRGRKLVSCVRVGEWPPRMVYDPRKFVYVTVLFPERLRKGRFKQF